MRHAREGAQAEYYRQFSFQPAINPRSRQMAQVHAARWFETYVVLCLTMLLIVTTLVCSCSAQLECRSGMAMSFSCSAACCGAGDPVLQRVQTLDWARRQCDTNATPSAQAHGLEELASDAQRRRSQAAIAAQAEAEFREACTFRPDTSASRCGAQLIAT